jgi:coatomer protein complex subunit alpha (xenin)
MQLLNRQIGAVNFEPLKPRFMDIYTASKTYLPASASLPPIVNYVRRNHDETDVRKTLPIIPHDLETLSNVDLQEGFTAMRTNKLDGGVLTFKKILQSLLVNVVSSQSQVDEAKALITKSMEYALAMSIELERRKVAAEGGDNQSEDQLKRQLELSAYFTVPKLDVAHRQIALMAAMKLAFSNKQFSSALSFANRVLANGGAAKLLEQVKFCVPSILTVTKIIRRRRKSRLNQSDPVHKTKWTLNTIPLPTLTCVPHRTRLFTAARRA